MKIEIQCKGMTITDAIRNHVEDKVGKLERVLPAGVEPVAHLAFESEAHGGSYSAEVNLRAWGQDVVSKSTTDDLYKAISEVADQLNKQIRRLKDKQKSRVKGGASVRHHQEPVKRVDEREEYEQEYQESLRTTETQEG